MTFSAGGLLGALAAPLVTVALLLLYCAAVACARRNNLIDESDVVSKADIVARAHQGSVERPSRLSKAANVESFRSSRRMSDGPHAQAVGPTPAAAAEAAVASETPLKATPIDEEP